MTDLVARLRRDATCTSHHEAADEIERLRAERDAARAESERLRGAGLGALATAVAAHSLLARGGKRAAPSDTMFLQMLSDYEVSIARARAALAKEPGHE